MLSDVQSFTSILYGRICAQFVTLQDPVFVLLLQSTITKAVFVHVVRRRCEEKNKAFIAAFQAYLKVNPEGISVLDVLTDESDPKTQEFVTSIDTTLEIASPMYKIRGYQALMMVSVNETNYWQNMFHYVYQQLQKEGITMETPEIMDNINTFILLVSESTRIDDQLNYEYFYPDLQFLLLFRDCTQLLPVNGNSNKDFQCRYCSLVSLCSVQQGVFNYWILRVEYLLEKQQFKTMESPYNNYIFTLISHY